MFKEQSVRRALLAFKEQVVRRVLLVRRVKLEHKVFKAQVVLVFLVVQLTI